jgi:SAM-dependent methyltransferase
MNAGQRLARIATDVVTRFPATWRLFRPLIRREFEMIAGRWDAQRSPGAYAPFEAALERVDPPSRALDVGTGTGAGALAIARRFVEAMVVGVDLAPAMIEAARRKTPPELGHRLRFEVADASKLPFEDDCFDLVALGNMIPFYDELARVLAPRGWALFSFSAGPTTPIWVPAHRLRTELERRRFTDFAEIHAGNGVAFLARNGDST